MDEADLKEIATLPVEDIQEEYKHLLQRYRQLQEINEQDAQRIHELKRNLETATAAETYLTQELEQLTNTVNDAESNAYKKLQAEIEELRRKYSLLTGDYDALQQDYAALSNDNAKIQAELQAKSSLNESIPAPVETATSAKIQRLNQLEEENIELLHKLEEYQESSVRYTMDIAKKDKTIEILRDDLTCLEENMRCKREEIEEKTHLLESAQEQLAEANAKIASLTTAPENNERKGNSLFAEVDDQRQAMKQLLASQKKSYMQMKKFCNESEHEIRRLKRENIAMHTELEACSVIFCSADKTYQDKLNERLRHLVNQNEDLERQLKWTQDRLEASLGGEKGVPWLGSMLDLCKQETDELKKQLYSIRIQKASLEEQLRNVQQDVARWRFEALKSRCILIDRENLLSEHKIVFKSAHNMELNITAKQLNEAQPRILSDVVKNKPLSETITNATTALKVEESKADDIKSNQSDLDEKHLGEAQRDECNKENNVQNGNVIAEHKSSNANTFSKENSQVDTNKNICAAIAIKPSNENVAPRSVITPGKLNSPRFDISVDKSLMNTNIIATNSFKPLNENMQQKKQPPHCDISPGKSILTKKSEIFANVTQKNVKFCPNEVTVHNISVNNSFDCTNDDAKTCSTNTIVKQVHVKSNVKVRRILVSSRAANH